MYCHARDHRNTQCQSPTENPLDNKYEPIHRASIQMTKGGDQSGHWKEENKRKMF